MIQWVLPFWILDMARYKVIDTSPRFLTVDLERQLLPGTFEHALNYLVDHELDLRRFDAPYRNDFTGAAAYSPALLLKVILFAYSRGIVSSREIERACREQVTFIALSGVGPKGSASRSFSSPSPPNPIPSGSKQIQC